MKRKILLTFFLLHAFTVFLSLNGCKKNKEAEALNTAVSEITLSRSNPTRNIKVESNLEWLIDGQGKEMLIGPPIGVFKWFSAEPVFGSGSKTVSFKLLEKNIPKSNESLILTIKGRSVNKTITVKFEE